MTAYELARRLLEGPDVMVTRRGYEGGVEEVKSVSGPMPIHIGAHSGSPYYGNHDYCESVGGYSCSYCMDDDYNQMPPPETVAIHLS